LTLVMRCWPDGSCDRMSGVTVAAVRAYLGHGDPPVGVRAVRVASGGVGGHGPPSAGTGAVSVATGACFHTACTSNGGTEAINGLIELHRRIARGFRNHDSYRLRMLLVGGGLTPT
jgi:hypothetical protein